MGVLLAGCGGSAQRTSSVGSDSTPRPLWQSRSAVRPEPAPERYVPAPRTPPSSSPGYMLGRSRWAGGRPVESRMNSMSRIRYITVHHDGMSPFSDTAERSSAQRIESIRRYHCDTLNWGDIGYHYVVDRSGRVWEGRPIGYQGAHVRNHNEGNIGVLLLGNFERQNPSEAQVDALRENLGWLIRQYNVPARHVLTHQEWDGARTACPGRSLQAYMNHLRHRGTLA